MRGAHAEVMELAAKLHSPIGHTLYDKEWIQYENPYDGGLALAAGKVEGLALAAGKVEGLALAAGKVVLDGGAGRMLELARANLRNVPRPSLAR